MTPFLIFTIIVSSSWGKCTVCLKDFNQCCLKLFWMEGALASIYYVSQCTFPFIFSVNETITVLWGGWHLQVHRVKKFIKSYQKMTSIVGVGFKFNIWIFCIWFYYQMIRSHMIFNLAFLYNVSFFYKYSKASVNTIFEITQFWLLSLIFQFYMISPQKTSQ